MATSTPGQRHGVIRRISASLGIAAAAAGLMAFATFGAFDNRQDPFPRSILGHVGATSSDRAR